MKILVTGGAGYIGSHVVLGLINSGYDVVIFDNLETGHIETVNTLKNIHAKGSVVDFVQGDLKNIEDIFNVLKSGDIEGVLHFAAYSQVGDSQINPEKYYYNNVFGTLNLLSAMRQSKVKRIVFSSTAATFGNPEYVPIDENHPQNPINTYGRTKLMIEEILKDYDRSYGIKSVILRYFNACGADSDGRIGEWHDPETHLIPNILKSTFAGGREFELYGTDYETKDGTCVRDYINVEDLADAHVRSLEYLINSGESHAYNLGSGLGNSVLEVFRECENVTGREIKVNKLDRRPGDPSVLIASSKKASDELGWIAERSLNQSIVSAYRWENVLYEKVNGVNV